MAGEKAKGPFKEYEVVELAKPLFNLSLRENCWDYAEGVDQLDEGERGTIIEIFGNQPTQLNLLKGKGNMKER